MSLKFLFATKNVRFYLWHLYYPRSFIPYPTPRGDTLKQESIIPSRGTQCIWNVRTKRSSSTKSNGARLSTLSIGYRHLDTSSTETRRTGCNCCCRVSPVNPDYSFGVRALKSGEKPLNNEATMVVEQGTNIMTKAVSFCFSGASSRMSGNLPTKRCSWVKGDAFLSPFWSILSLCIYSYGADQRILRWEKYPATSLLSQVVLLRS